MGVPHCIVCHYKQIILDGRLQSRFVDPRNAVDEITYVLYWDCFVLNSTVRVIESNQLRVVSVFRVAIVLDTVVEGVLFFCVY